MSTPLVPQDEGSQALMARLGISQEEFARKAQLMRMYLQDNTGCKTFEEFEAKQKQLESTKAANALSGPQPMVGTAMGPVIAGMPPFFNINDKNMQKHLRNMNGMPPIPFSFPFNPQMYPMMAPGKGNPPPFVAMPVPGAIPGQPLPPGAPGMPCYPPGMWFNPMNPVQPIVAGQPPQGVGPGTPWPGFPGAPPSQLAQSTSQDKKPTTSDPPAKSADDDAASPIATNAKNTEPAAAPVTQAEGDSSLTCAESPSAPPSPRPSSQTLPKQFDFPGGFYLPTGQPFAPGQALPPGFFPAPMPFPPGMISNVMLASSMAAKYRTNFQFPTDDVDPKQIFNLPPEPYSQEKPKWSYAALIGQALNAAKRGRACLDHIYLYLSTVYPFYKRSEQAWQNSIRHNLSQNSSFTRLKHPQGGQHGEWAIREEDKECFRDGGYVRPSGTAYTKGRRKRRRKGAYDDDTELEDDESPRKRQKGSKAEPTASVRYSVAGEQAKLANEVSSQINETASARGTLAPSIPTVVVEQVSRGKKRSKGTKSDAPKGVPFDDVHSGEDNDGEHSVFALPSRRDVISKQQAGLSVSPSTHRRKAPPKSKNTKSAASKGTATKSKGGRSNKRARAPPESEDGLDDVDELQDDEDLFPHIPPPSYMTGESSVAEGLTGGDDDDWGSDADEPNNSGSAVHVPGLTPNKDSGASSSPPIESPQDAGGGREDQGDVKDEQEHGDESALLRSSETGKNRLGANELAKLRSGTKDLLEATLREKERLKEYQRPRDKRRRDRMGKASSSQTIPQPSTPPISSNALREKPSTPSAPPIMSTFSTSTVLNLSPVRMLTEANNSDIRGGSPVSKPEPDFMARILSRFPANDPERRDDDELSDERSIHDSEDRSRSATPPPLVPNPPWIDSPAPVPPVFTQPPPLPVFTEPQSPDQLQTDPFLRPSTPPHKRALARTSSLCISPNSHYLHPPTFITPARTAGPSSHPYDEAFPLLDVGSSPEPYRLPGVTSLGLTPFLNRFSSDPVTPTRNNRFIPFSTPGELFHSPTMGIEASLDLSMIGAEGAEESPGTFFGKERPHKSPELLGGSPREAEK